jgi:hypothetical protein
LGPCSPEEEGAGWWPNKGPLWPPGRLGRILGRRLSLTLLPESDQTEVTETIIIMKRRVQGHQPHQRRGLPDSAASQSEYDIGSPQQTVPYLRLLGTSSLEKGVVLRYPCLWAGAQQWNQRRASGQWRTTLLLCATISYVRSSLP